VGGPLLAEFLDDLADIAIIGGDSTANTSFNLEWSRRSVCVATNAFADTHRVMNRNRTNRANARPSIAMPSFFLYPKTERALIQDFKP
jgi:hypothetical protein